MRRARGTHLIEEQEHHRGRDRRKNEGRHCTGNLCIASLLFLLLVLALAPAIAGFVSNLLDAHIESATKEDVEALKLRIQEWHAKSQANYYYRIPPLPSEFH